jgi:predicted nicotinamide N-methyase
VKYPVVIERKRIGDIELDFTRVADPDAVLDAICEEETRRAAMGADRPEGYLRMPYWAAVWESATAVGQLLQRRRALLQDPCLDLGCGMGLAGMIAAALGLHVTLGDIEEDCLDIARVNCAPWPDRTTVRRVDWCTDDLRTHYGLLIGSDVLYEREQWDNIEAFLKRHTNPSSYVVLGEPRRPKADEFQNWITARGWTCEVEEQTVETKLTRVFVLRRS